MDLNKLASAGFDLKGKFHSHVTVQLQGVGGGLQKLKDFCRSNRGMKPTLVDLQDFLGSRAVDAMVTKHYFDDKSGAVARIASDLELVSRGLTNLGLIVLRVKLEHESQPSLQEFSEETYREVHVRLALDSQSHAKSMEFLKENARTFGYAPSANLFSTKGDVIGQFLTLRHYSGNVEESNNKIQDLLGFLDSNAILVTEVKREVVAFDTNLQLDKWWA